VNKLFFVAITTVLFLLIDLYIYQALKVVTGGIGPVWRRLIFGIYWFITMLAISGLWFYNYANPDGLANWLRRFILIGIFIIYFSKLFTLVFLMLDDIIRLFRWVGSLFTTDKASGIMGKSIPRSEFLVKTAIVAGTIPLLAMGYGIISGAHDYRIRRHRIVLPNLPKAFDGIKLLQLSDIHTGSFFNKKAVKGGIEMAINEKPDLVFFTGDLVNNETDEVNGYYNIFNKVHAPLGVFSTLGNHDYGDYHRWSSPQAKKDNLASMHVAHKELGWDLLNNKNRYIEVDGEKICVIGVENWGAGRFTKYGKLDEACVGTDDAPVKLLLSHDPSHWDAQVRPQHPEIDMMFAGHTHGFQFGVEIGNFKWSPAQYAYKQWAGLYEAGDQKLYVNRGFGFIGYPGRVGIPPEITVFELVRA